MDHQFYLSLEALGGGLCSHRVHLTSYAVDQKQGRNKRYEGGNKGNGRAWPAVADPSRYPHFGMEKFFKCPITTRSQ
jgi:hypothetical protein